MSSSEPHRSASSLFYGLTLFLSAGLLFAVQPLLGKQMLPLVGGSPSGWLTALAFFQLALLVGYLVAHGLSRLSARQQALATAVLLVVGAVFLPPRLVADAGMNVGSVWAVLGLLFQGIFLPYVGLATVSSGLQRLYAARSGGKDPYFLYAASNAGSFAGLLAYPLIVEPLLPLSTQGIIWAVGYGLLVAMIGLLAWGKGTPELVATTQSTTATATSEERISWGRRGEWVLLAFIPSSLSMGLTALVTADLGSFPLLWVIPLGLYLLTFVIAFKEARPITVATLSKLQLAATVPLIAFFIVNGGSYATSWVTTLIPLIVFFVSALWCHMRLADDRPAPASLTEYYLWMSLGGALGGSFNAFIAPLLFAYPIEFILVAAGALLLQRPTSRPLAVGLPLLGLFLALGAAYLLQYYMVEFVVPLLVALFLVPLALVFYPRLLAVSIVAIVLFTQTGLVARNRVAIDRNFFGVVEIVDRKNAKGEGWRFYINGSGVHGMQSLTPQPLGFERNLTYLNPVKALADVFAFDDVGILGAGPAMAVCLSEKQRATTIYEIDPLSKVTAEQHFSYIKECGQPTWRMGDGRLELARDISARYDLLIIDAFTAGSVPLHLLTKEALAVYVARLKDKGIVLFNTNNLYYNFSPAILALAEQAGLQAWEHHANPKPDFLNGVATSNWMLLTAASHAVDQTALLARGWKKMEQTKEFPVWTDELANVLATLKFLQN